MKFDVRVDDGGLLDGLTVADAVIRDETARVVYRAGARTRTQVRANASGRPGPRVQAGDYRRSIAQTNALDGTVPVAVVFTNSPQAARLEYGFRGVDAAGRRFNQSPLPHWRPAADKIPEFLAAEAQRLVDRALQRLGGAS